MRKDTRQRNDPNSHDESSQKALYSDDHFPNMSRAMELLLIVKIDLQWHRLIRKQQ